jgi:P27 family predicted phage terminase small subunit
VYCECWARFVAAVKQYRQEGVVLINPDSGRQHQHPAVGIAHTAAAQLLTYAREFGLTPSAEQRLATTAPELGDGGDPFGA